MGKITWYYLTAFLLAGTQLYAQQPSVPLQYQLQYAGNSIHVQFTYQPQEKDSTIFAYGDLAFGGQKDIMKGLQNLTIIAPAQLKPDTANRRVMVYFNSANAIHISYNVVDTRTVDDTRSQLFRPIITQEYIFVHGINLFLTPKFRVDAPNTLVSVQWATPPPFPLFYAFDPANAGNHASVITLDSIAYRFITGAKDLQVKAFPSESGASYLALRTAGINATTEQQIEKFYLGYNRSLRTYWQDKRVIQYALVLQPFINVDHDMSGVSYGNGFIGKYNRADSLVYGQRRFVIAHEMGHYYLGDGDLKAYDGEHNEGQWFDEGFNDYNTYVNLLNTGEITAAEFETDFNKILKDLYASPIKNTANDKIFENFWKLGDYSKLPYWRGCVYAFYLDNQIALATKGKHSLRDVLLALLKHVKSTNEKNFSNDVFINVLAKYLPRAQVLQAFDSYIQQGASIMFGNDMLMPGIQVANNGGIPVLHITNATQFVKHYTFK